MIQKTFHAAVFVSLTILTQVGGVIYLCSILLISKRKRKYRWKRIVLFLSLYLLATLFLIPRVALIFGRQKIEQLFHIRYHNVLTALCNRNYVSKELHRVLIDISLQLQEHSPNIQLVYLDANFPFIDGFPLLPHLSHNDGKKIDLSFVYQDLDGNVTNDKPSNSGYGVFEYPQLREKNQTEQCKSQGNWQYDFTKYLTFGSTDQLELNPETTKRLIKLLCKHPKTQKVFIEPHLKKRWGLRSDKIRFQGCSAVRHDDHIHLQIN